MDIANTITMKNIDIYRVLPPTEIPKMSSPVIKATTEIIKNINVKIPAAELKSWFLLFILLNKVKKNIYF